MIKNIILDMGNVLLDYNPQIPLDAFCRSGAEKDLIKKELFEGPEWAMGDQGLIKDAERYDLVKERVPKEHWEALRKCCKEWDICMNPIEGAREFCEYVKAQNYGIYILSNASDLFYKYFTNFLPFDFFDGIVVSSDIRMLKPDRKIYEYTLERYQLKAEECLFIDDRSDNVEAARAVGMQAHPFRNDFEEIKKMLATPQKQNLPEG